LNIFFTFFIVNSFKKQPFGPLGVFYIILVKKSSFFLNPKIIFQKNSRRGAEAQRSQSSNMISYIISKKYMKKIKYFPEK